MFFLSWMYELGSQNLDDKIWGCILGFTCCGKFPYPLNRMPQAGAQQHILSALSSRLSQYEALGWATGRC